jgi:hypothetical protein
MALVRERTIPTERPPPVGEGLTLTQNVDWGFLLSTTFPTSGVVTQPHYIYIYIYICPLRVFCPVSRPITTLDCVLLKDNNQALVARSGPEPILEPVSVYYKDHATIPDAVFPSSVSSFFLYSAYRPPRKTQVQQTADQNRPLRACRPFHVLALWLKEVTYFQKSIEDLEFHCCN